MLVHFESYDDSRLDEVDSWLRSEGYGDILTYIGKHGNPHHASKQPLLRLYEELYSDLCAAWEAECDMANANNKW